jgi:hypothetical protein
MPVAFVTVCGDSFADDATSLTSASFTPAGDDLAVLSFLGTYSFGGYSAPTAFNHGGSGGSAMTSVLSRTDQTGVFANFYRYLNPAESSATTYIDWASERLKAIVGSLVYSGVDQTTPIENETSNIGDFDTTGGTATLTVTCQSGDTVVGALFALDFSGGAITFDAGSHTVRYEVATGVTTLGGGIVVEQVASGTSQVLSIDVDVPAANFVTWVFIGGVIRAAAGGIEAVAADTLTVSDSAVSTTERLAVATDTNTPTDSAVSTTARLAEATDSLSLSDSAEGVVALPAVAEDSLSLSDSAEGVSARVAVAEDTITFSDAAAVGIEVEVEAEDSLTLTDSAVGSIAPPPPPPAPPSVLPLPAKLLGWAPGKRPKKGAAKTGNVVFKPAREEEEESEARTGVEPAADELNLPTLASPAVVLGLDVPPPFSLGELALPPLPVFEAPPPIVPAPLPAAVQPLSQTPITAAAAAPPPVEVVEFEPLPQPTAAVQLIELANRVAQEREETIALREVVPALRDAVAELRANRDADLKRQRDTLADKVASGLVAVAALVTAGAKPATVRAALRRVAEDVGRSGAIPPEPSDLEAENQRRREAAQKILDALPED